MCLNILKYGLMTISEMRESINVFELFKRQFRIDTMSVCDETQIKELNNHLRVINKIIGAR